MRSGATKKQRRNVAIIAAPGAPHATAMADALRALGCTPFIWNVGHSHEVAPLTIGSDAPEPAFDVAYVDLLPLAAPRAFRAEGAYFLYDDWQRDWQEARARRAVLEATFADLERRGVTLVSSPLSATAYNKPAQLACLSRAGFSVPPFVITNDAKVARAFLGEHDDAVMKPAMGGGHCLPVNAEQVDDLPLRRAPMIFQKRVRGDDIRVTTVRGEMLSAVRVVNDDADPSVVDFRAQRAYHQGTTRYQPVKVDAKLTRLCTRILENCGMHFGGIDFKRDAKGKLHLLECNVQPGWLAIEAATGAPVCEGLARYLLALRATSGRRRR
ncbi:MAG: RimK family alpha-L-glutamate ligase [Myxococcota bacterium]|nr:hypothetical protein [Myxococcota bacterium]